MPVVPITPGQGANNEPVRSMPSNTNLMMAMAEMNRLGRFTDQEEMDTFERGLNVFNRRDPQFAPKTGVDHAITPGEERVPDRERGGTKARDVRVI